MRVLPSPCRTSLGETCQEMVTLKKYGPLHCFPLKQKKKKKKKGSKQKQSGIQGACWQNIFHGSQLTIHLPFAEHQGH